MTASRHVPPSNTRGESLIRAEALTKRFPGTLANDRVTFEVLAGEVHALLGENGAGKSTLMNMLNGLLEPDEGSIFWRGRKVSIPSPRAAANLGIGMVHQHFMLVPRLSVLENATLGLPKAVRGSRTEAERRLGEIARQLGMDIDVHRPVETLSVGERQKVEIVRLLFRRATLLILDEPTSALAPQEVDQLFGACRSIADRGNAVIFITHRLEEVLAFSDRVTVLRAGRNVATLDTQATGARELAHLMVGREMPAHSARRPAAQSGAALLSVSGLSTIAGPWEVPLDGISFEVGAGEIVGIAGVDGNGQDELVESLLGLRRPRSGRIALGGVDVSGMVTREILSRGVSVVPADRHESAIIEDFDLVRNVLLGLGPDPPWVHRGFVDWGEVRRTTAEIVRNFAVKAGGPGTRMSQLSGGHQQRLVLGRALQKKPRLLIAAQPTRGLDIESSHMVRNRLLEMASSGCGVLLVSMDLDEIMLVSDRMAVLFAGRIIGWAGRETGRPEIGLLMAGVAPAGREPEA
jgi:general nucleoside transport system ATP-binding protein